jgi:hypothetical protein
MKLPSPKTAAELLDMYYLELRCNLIEAAATFDRIERAPGWNEAQDDPRMLKLRESLAVLGSSGPDRAERFLKLFSVR